MNALRQRSIRRCIEECNLVGPDKVRSELGTLKVGRLLAVVTTLGGAGAMYLARSSGDMVLSGVTTGISMGLGGLASLEIANIKDALKSMRRGT